VVLRARRNQGWRFAGANARGILDDGALLGLAEDLREPDRGDADRCQEIAQHLSWSHRRQLITVPPQDETGRWAERPEHSRGQKNIEHARLIDDQHISRERIGLIVDEAIARPCPEQRCSVLASAPITSAMRFAALPVGAASRTD